MATFRLTMKDPDYTVSDLSVEGTKTLLAFLDYDEYVTIEFDTENCTARVVPVRELK